MNEVKENAAQGERPEFTLKNDLKTWDDAKNAVNRVLEKRRKRFSRLKEELAQCRNQVT